MRASVRSVRTRVNVSAIQSYFRAGGGVYRDAATSGRLIRRRAEFLAPSRTGVLKSRHTGPQISTTYLGTHITVGNNSDHALFVHEGTVGPIFPHNPTGYLWVRPQPHSWYAPNYDPFGHGFDIDAGGRTPRRSVRGQRANPWLARAMNQQITRRYRRA